MKKAHLILSVLLSVFLFSACSSTQSTTTEKKKKSGTDYSTYANLAHILRRMPGVTVSGDGGPTTTVQIRGMNSLMLDTRPLYVIDGAVIGRDYARANEAINTADIASVRVIKDLAQLTKYGEQGRNGVIYIRSKGGNK